MIALPEIQIPEKYNPTTSIYFNECFTVENLFSISGSSAVVLVSEISPTLSHHAKRDIHKIAAFGDYRPNWDSYGAEAPSGIAIEKAIQFIKKLDDTGTAVYFSAPGPNGEILLELRNGKREIEIYFNPDGSIESLLYEDGEFKLNAELDDIISMLLT